MIPKIYSLIMKGKIVTKITLYFDTGGGYNMSVSFEVSWWKKLCS